MPMDNGTATASPSKCFRICSIRQITPDQCVGFIASNLYVLRIFVYSPPFITILIAGGLVLTHHPQNHTQPPTHPTNRRCFLFFIFKIKHCGPVAKNESVQSILVVSSAFTIAKIVFFLRVSRSHRIIGSIWKRPTCHRITVLRNGSLSESQLVSAACVFRSPLQRA